MKKIKLIFRFLSLGLACFITNANADSEPHLFMEEIGEDGTVIATPWSITAPPSEPKDEETKSKTYIFHMAGGITPSLFPSRANAKKIIESYGKNNEDVEAVFKQNWSKNSIRKEIKRIKEENPDAKIILMGHSMGSGAAFEVANWLNKQDYNGGKGIPIDLLVTVDTSGLRRKYQIM